MALPSGSRLGPYEIVAPLGAGGMGEVYRATDTRLDRTVAIKILSSRISNHSDLKQRFEREARVISSLTHPHICALYDVGSQDGTEFLVMEFLEGETLAHRLIKGPLPTDQMLRFGIQIADALDKAHRQGIVHRDLKPGNIMLTKSGVKLLDFGLAKLRSAKSSPSLSKVSVLPTKDRDITTEGTILGTIQYMAPEQLEGQETDTRADIFACGTVLYEMATGKKAFTGNSQASLMSAILKDEPSPISQIQPLSPLPLDRVVKTCMAKDPDDRWQNAHDLMKELTWIADGSSTAVVSAATKPARFHLLPWMIAGVLFLIAIASWFPSFKPRTAPEKLLRLSILSPPETELIDAPAVSPDGSRIVFPAADKHGKTYLWIRSLQSTAAEKVPGTEGAANPFWSADSQAIGFFAKGKLMKVDPSHGLSQALCDVADQRGGAWNKDGIILFSPNPYDGLYRINNTGGALSKVTVLDSATAEGTHRFPYFLPDGKHFFFFVKGQKGEGGVYVGSLDSQEKSFLLNSDRSAVFSSGYLLFQRGNTLFAQPFDTNKLKLSGEAIPLSENVWHEPQTWGTRGVAVSDNNLLTYVEGSNLSQLQWFDHTGNQLGLISSIDQYAGTPAFSPDGKRFAISVVDGGFAHIWLYETSSGSRSRLTFSQSYNVNSRWSPDGKRIVFSSTRDGLLKLYLRDSKGTGNDELLFQSKDACLSDDWSPNGQYIVFSQVDPKTKYDLWILRLGQQKSAFPFLQTEANESQARFSPDGNWIAYCSDESGQPEVYVQPVAKEGGKWQISTSGGMNPKWSRDGKELFYLSLDNQIMSSEVKIGSVFEATVSKPLFAIHPYTTQRIGSQSYSAFEPGPDGRRIAVHSSLSSSPPNITVVLNWTQLLKSKR